MSTDDPRARHDIRSLIDKVPVPPSNVTVRAAIAAGRRAEVRAWWRAAAAATAAILVVSAGTVTAAAVLVGRRVDATSKVGPTAPHTVEIRTSSPRDLDCTPVALDMPAANGPASPQAGVTAGDGTGRYLAGEAHRVGPSLTTMVRWVDGRPSLVDVFGAESLWVAGVNSSGEVVGSAPHAGGHVAWVYRDGAVRRLALPPGYRTAYAYDINDRGDVVGRADRGPGDGSGRASAERVAVLWPGAAPDQPVVLDAPGDAMATSVDDDGTVLGLVSGQPGFGATVDGERTYVWRPDGTPYPLPVPAGWETAMASSMRNGWVAGATTRKVRQADDDTAAALWNLRTGEVRVFPDLFRPDNVSASGWFTLGSPAGGTIVVQPDGDIGHVNRDTGVRGEYGPFLSDWLSDDGLSLSAGPPPGTNGADHPTIWRCRPW